jgi:hypothetical protein
VARVESFVMTLKEFVGSWIGPRATTIPLSIAAKADAAQRMPPDAGEYTLLYEYLRGRFADRIVLTFAEIEDVLGFPLPESAHLQPEWWAGTDPVAPLSAQGGAWTRAKRTATVNLRGKRVTFERPGPEGA